MARQLVEPSVAEEQRFRMTYDEFLAWADEDTHAEWVDGEVIVFVPPGSRHQRIAFFLAKLLSFFVDRFGLGEVMIPPFEMRILAGRSSRQPDILFISRARRDQIDARRLEGPASLVVELVSATSVTRDRRDKLREYQEAGIEEYWVVDVREGKEEFAPYRLTPDGNYQLASLDPEGRYETPTIPGFWFRPEWLWMEPLPEPIELLVTVIAPHILDTFPRQPSTGR